MRDCLQRVAGARCSRLFSIATAQLVKLEWDHNHWGERDAGKLCQLLANFVSVLELDLSHTEMGFEGCEMVANSIAKLDTVKQMHTLRWGYGRLMGKYDELNPKLNMLECAGPYEKPGLIALCTLFESLEAVAHLDLSGNFIEQSGDANAPQ
eukprot:5404543-Prymnesium_polylepis.1